MREAKRSFDRRASRRRSSGGAVACTLVITDRALHGTLWDVSSTGAKLVFRRDDYRDVRQLLMKSLETESRLEIEMQGAERPFACSLVWYGVVFDGGFAVGVRGSGLDAAIGAGTSEPASPLRLLGVRHHASRRAGLGASLRRLFSTLDAAEFSLDTALGALTERVRELTGAEGVTFWAIEGPVAVLRAQAGRWQMEFGSTLPLGGDVALIPSFAMLKETLRKGQQLFANRADRSIFSDHPGVKRFGLQSIMILPVFGAEVDFGVLIFGHATDPYAFGATEQTEAEVFANQAALFFEKAQLLQDLRGSTGFLEAMNRIALAFHERLDVDRVLDVICAESRRLFGVDLATAFLREEDGFVQRAAAGMRVSPRKLSLREPGIREARLVRQGEAFYVNGFDESELSRSPLVRSYMGREPARSVMVLPIRDGDEVLGTLTLADKTNANRFSARDLEKGRILAEQAARALVNARLYERVGQSKRILHQQDRFRVLGELAGVVAHEIKNALVPLRTLVELLPQRYEDADFREWYAKTVRQEVDRMHELVTQLSRFRTARAAAAEVVDPGALLKSVADLVTPEARARQIVLQVEAEPLPAVPLAANEIRQVLLNLLLNAIQAIEENGTVRAGVRLSADDSGILFWVADDGPGIPSDKVERIFDPLYTTKEAGSGLGLAIARDIVQAHGGTLSVDSAEGEGATFTVSLPVAGLRTSKPVVH